MKIVCGLVSFLCILLLSCPGCETLTRHQRRQQLERVAKDWSLTIRASQVVPVYPLTQDFQPGDVFLVQQSVGDQARLFEKKGFLPIDMLVSRVGPDSYGKFYDQYVYHGDSYPGDSGDTGTPVRLPGQWRAKQPEDSWVKAPRAGFPSYTFSVSASAGLSLAVPVQAVPVGLSLMGSSRASGSVTITNAFTYGVDIASLEQQVRGDQAVLDLLQRIAIPDCETYYIRVVNRVFATKSMLVTLNTTGASSGGLDVGVPKQVEIETGEPSSINQVKAINAALESTKDALPGGSIRAVSAQNRSVTFDEKFDEPIVFGYHGFDMAILPDRTLGPVVPTFLVLSGTIEPPTTAISQQDTVYLGLLGTLRTLEQTDRDRAESVVKAAAIGNSRLMELLNERLARPNTTPSAAWISAATLYTQSAPARAEQITRVRDVQSRLMMALGSN